MRRGQPDEGSVSVFVIALVVVLMVVAGLVVDGGRAVNARSAAMDVAEQAARAGANQVDLAALRDSGAVRVDTAAGRAAALSYVAAAGYAPDRATVRADDEHVEVTVRADVPTALLSLIFIHSFPVEGTATARAAIGITDEIPVGAP